jgi:hypothetical protein
LSVLGVTALGGRTFESIGLPKLAASPAVFISENYWQRRFAGDPAMLGKTIRLNGAAFVVVGITPHHFIGTSVAVPDFWLPLSLEPVVHPESHRLRERDDLCCRVFGRLAPGVSMAQAQAETMLLASQLRTLHDPHSDLSKDVTALISRYLVTSWPSRFSRASCSGWRRPLRAPIASPARRALWAQHRRCHLLRRCVLVVPGHRTGCDLATVPTSDAS